MRCLCRTVSTSSCPSSLLFISSLLSASRPTNVNMFFRPCQNRPPAAGEKHIRHYSLRQPGSNTSALRCSEQQCCESYTFTHKAGTPAESASCVFIKNTILLMMKQSHLILYVLYPSENGGLSYVLKNNPKRRIKLWFMGNFKIKVYYCTLHAISLTCCDVIINLWIQFIDLSEV